MNKSIKYLAPDKRRQLEEIKRIVFRLSRPEMIILFGIFAEQQSGIDTPEFPPVLQVFDLLIAVKKGNSKELSSLQSIIEDKCAAHAPINLTILSLQYINDRLIEGNYFFYQIAQNGILIHSHTGAQLAKPTPPALVKARQIAEQDFRFWSTQAIHFYECASTSMGHGYLRSCAFLLHQAVEQMYQAILLTHTGHKPATHNLNKLRRSTAKFSARICEIFPDRTDDDRRLFHLLVISYIDARYSQNFQVAEKDLIALLHRVRHFLALGQTICRLHLELLYKLSLQHETLSDNSDPSFENIKDK